VSKYLAAFSVPRNLVRLFHVGEQTELSVFDGIKVRYVHTNIHTRIAMVRVAATAALCVLRCVTSYHELRTVMYHQLAVAICRLAYMLFRTLSVCLTIAALYARCLCLPNCSCR
jgi:hypothetical protein